MELQDSTVPWDLLAQQDRKVQQARTAVMARKANAGLWGLLERWARWDRQVQTARTVRRAVQGCQAQQVEKASEDRKVLLVPLGLRGQPARTA